MAKRRKLKRCNKPVPEGTSGYAARHKLSLRKRHSTHTRTVHGCPLCVPGSTKEAAAEPSSLSPDVDMTGI